MIFCYEAVATGLFPCFRGWPHTHPHTVTALPELTGLFDIIFRKELQQQSGGHCGVTSQALEKHRGPINSTNLLFRATVWGFPELSKVLRDKTGNNHAAYCAVRTQGAYECDSETSHEIKQLN